MAQVTISTRGAKRIRLGHLWVYRSDVREASDGAGGAIGRVVDEAGNFVGQAFYSDRSEIALRFLTTHEVAIDRESDSDCILLDTTGELQRWYGIATIVFIGKSLTAQGGQNPVEPIMAGKPVVFGPHMENFATLAKALVLKKGAIQVGDVDSLEMTIAGLLRDSDARQRLLENARDVLSKHHGATARAAALIHELKNE